MVRESTVAVDSMRARLSAMGILKAPRSPPQTPLDLPPPSPRRADPHAALREQLVHLFREDAAAFEALVEAARREGMS